MYDRKALASDISENSTHKGSINDERYYYSNKSRESLDYIYEYGSLS